MIFSEDSARSTVPFYGHRRFLHSSAYMRVPKLARHTPCHIFKRARINVAQLTRTGSSKSAYNHHRMVVKGWVKLGVEHRLLVPLPAHAHAPLLPRGQVVEVDAALKEQLVLGLHRQA